MKGIGFVEGLIVVGLLAPSACTQENSGTPRPPSSAPAAAKTADPPAKEPGVSGPGRQMPPVDTTGVKLTDVSLVLTGISFRIPEGWQKQEPAMNPQMPGSSRKAQFRLPKSDKEPEDVEVAMTHFPEMKGKDDLNLQRWYDQFSQPDGRSSAEAAAKMEFQAGSAAVILIDVSGTMKGGAPMMGGGAAKDGYRMLAAIVNHPKGPHYFKLTGPAAGVERWKASAVAFLKSVTVTE